MDPLLESDDRPDARLADIPAPTDEVEPPYRGMILPATQSPVLHDSPTHPLTRNILSDEGSINRLLDEMLRQSGLDDKEAARIMGVHVASLRQYLYGRRTRPSLQWFIRFAEATGSRVQVKMVKKN